MTRGNLTFGQVSCCPVGFPQVQPSVVLAPDLKRPRRTLDPLNQTIWSGSGPLRSLDFSKKKCYIQYKA
jgi:hypothetical protein